MRIISGIARGIQLTPLSKKCQHLRPTSDRCKEALFSIIGDEIQNATVLDLFAGTGSLGLESLSRGASCAVFMDSNTVSLSIIEKNCNRVVKNFEGCPSKPQLAIIKTDIPRGLKKAIRSLQTDIVKFDIVFLDPPYDKGLAQKTLAELDALDCLTNKSLLIAEELDTVMLPDDFNSFQLIDKRSYGDTSFWMYRKR